MCAIANWRTTGSTVLKLDRDVGHDKETTSINITVIRSMVKIIPNTKVCLNDNWKTLKHTVIKLGSEVGREL